MQEPGVLVVDVGGNNAKCWCSNGTEKRKMPTGATFTPQALVEGVTALCVGWSYDRITLGCPGPCAGDRLLQEPVNLGRGWAGFDFTAAFGLPVRVINDAAMQALGSYDDGRMLFLGFGTGLGNCIVVDGRVIGLELGHLPYRKGETYEDVVGQRGLVRLGRKAWRKEVDTIIQLLRRATIADYVVLGGGNVKLIEELPEFCRRGSNDRAFTGGLRVWQDQSA